MSRARNVRRASVWTWSTRAGFGLGLALAVSLALGAAFAAPAGAMQMAAAGELAACLPGAWLHAVEEDTGGVEVYRPAAYPLPPARGRTGFELLPGGALVMREIAPADGPLLRPGQWALAPPDQLHLSVEGASPVVRQIVSCEETILMLAAAG